VSDFILMFRAPHAQLTSNSSVSALFLEGALCWLTLLEGVRCVLCFLRGVGMVDNSNGLAHKDVWISISQIY
jgi:hypothetical protein